MSSGELLLGVDVGTTSARAALFDANGSMLASSGVSYETSHPRPGWAEQHPYEIQAAVEAAVRRVSANRGEQVAGCALASTAVSVVTVDASGEAIGPVILWMDTRASKEAAEINARNHPALRYTGGSVSPEWMLPKALWLKRNDPERYHQTAYLVEIHDWLVHRWTGQWVLSLPTVCAEWSYVPELGGWPVELLEAVGLKDVIEKWPNDILHAGEAVGGLTAEAAAATKLPEGLPLSQGLMDSYAAACACDVFSPGRLSLSLGSSSCYLAMTKRPIFDERLLGPVAGAFGPSRWIVQGGQTSAASTLDWFVRHLAPGRTYRYLDEEAELLPPGSEGVWAMDTFQGCRTPHRDPASRGAFGGLNLSHGRAHLYRSLLEAVAYGGRQIVEVMGQCGVVASSITACGGGARSPLWMQIHADVLGRPVSVIDQTEPAALGAALSAGVGIGIYPNLETGTTAAYRIAHTYEPRPEVAEAYAQGYRRYLRTYSALHPNLLN
jgi:FGGY-family pentulose kinase